MTIAFMKSTEQDLLDYLETIPNKAGYIKQLIREDMALRNQPISCDRNICFKNEMNGIGCEECGVNKK